MGVMGALFAGLATFDVVHLLDHVPEVTLKTTSVGSFTGAGGPATNAAVAFAALCRATGADAATTLLTALGGGTTASAMGAELGGLGVHVLDATDPCQIAPSAMSSIIEHPGGRFVASTNARVPVDAGAAQGLLGRELTSVGTPDVVLVDGHNPELAALALAVHDRAGRHPPRILDGGSWKDWFEPLLGQVDVAVVSADFAPPGSGRADVAAALRRYGITRVVRTNGPDPVEWWWDGATGQVPVPPTHTASTVGAVSTMGAGDVFHGAFAWFLARHPGAAPADVVSFASRVAGLSVRALGTRAWIDDPELPGLCATCESALRA